MLITLAKPMGYCVRMRRASKIIHILASVSFLAITLSGFHIHADAANHDEAAPHGHLHSYIAPPELDEDHVDICLFEPATKFSEAEIIALFLALPTPSARPRLEHVFLADVPDPAPKHHHRWRPQLRAPPSLI